MNLWIIAAIVVGLLVVGGIAVTYATAQQEKNNRENKLFYLWKFLHC